MLLWRGFFLWMLWLCAAAQAEVDWRNCGTMPLLDPKAEKVKVQCARISVPMAYAHDGTARHDQRKVYLQLHRVPARGKRLGVLLLVSGGPGEPSVLRLLPADLLPAKVREHFDVVAYDPRGIAGSSPRVRCDNNPLLDARAFVESCVAQTHPVFLPHVGTFEAAHDVERIRRALGEERLNIIGYSYGSKVAVRHALHYPQSVRALVLDGVVNVQHGNYRWRERQQRGFQQAAERFLEACQKVADCPFAGVQADQQMLHALMAKRAGLERAEAEKKEKNPFLGLLEKGGLRGRRIPADYELLEVFYLGLLQEEHWPSLAHVMGEFLAGKAETFREHFGFLMDHKQMDALVTLTCADVAARDVGGSVILQRHLALLSPWDNHHLPYRREEAWPCAHWPHVGSDYRHPLPPLPENLPQILLVSREHDPTTPWQNAREMADWLHAPLLTVAGSGHIVAMTGRSVCADEVVVDYLFQPEKPLRDRHCSVGNGERTLARGILLLGVVWLLWWGWRRWRKRRAGNA
ncbi:MAG: alpha/beta fold hydrolase [Cardiobacteriaceae bacterium]|nr:alpha/beta fold hydrolase [Cardiobacteriaceae bacterium]